MTIVSPGTISHTDRRTSAAQYLAHRQECHSHQIINPGPRRKTKTSKEGIIRIRI